MAWTAAALALSAALGAGATMAGSARSNAQAKQQEALAGQQLADARQNQLNQQLVQAMINQRSIAGQADDFGSTIRFDPATNTWVSKLGDQPRAVQTAANLADISRNTTDLRRAQMANEAAASRATQAAPAYDAAIRNLQNFRPMESDQLIGLMQQRATEASNETFRPLVADTLRSFARTGTAAGPVLGQIGKSAAQSLRDSMVDAQLKGMTGVDQINQGRRQGLEQSAANASSLASPSFQYPGVQASDASKTLASALANKGYIGATAPSYAMGGVNTGAKQVQDAYNASIKNVSDPNFGMNMALGGIKDLSKELGQGGPINQLIKQLTAGGGGSDSLIPQSTIDYNKGYQASAFDKAGAGAWGPFA